MCSPSTKLGFRRHSVELPFGRGPHKRVRPAFRQANTRTPALSLSALSLYGVNRRMKNPEKTPDITTVVPLAQGYPVTEEFEIASIPRLIFLFAQGILRTHSYSLSIISLHI